MKKIILFLFLPFFSFSQDVLNNQSIIKMIELGFDEQVIIDKIQNSSSNFETSIEKLKNLKESGVSSNILSVIIKSKNQDESKNSAPPKNDDTFFYWENGKGELVKVLFNNYLLDEYELDNTEISGWTQRIMLEAQFKLKSKLSFIPTSLIIRERLKTDKWLTDNDKSSHVVQLGYSATNSYGGMLEGFKIIGVNPNLNNKKNTLKSKLTSSDSSSKEFIFKKCYLDGKSVKMKGKITISEEYLIIDLDNSPSMSMSIRGKEIIGENHWGIKTTQGGVSVEFEFNGEEKKYKTDGGVLTQISTGYKMEYPLFK